MVGYSNGKTVVSSGKKTPILKSLDKAFELLECYIQDGSSYTIDELARKLQVSKGTIHRILVTAQKRGFMEQDVMTKRYHLGLKLFELGTAVANRMDLRKESLPILNILSKKTGQASQILIKSNGDAIGIEKLEGKSYLRMLFLDVGKKMPLHIGAGPKVLLAYS